MTNKPLTDDGAEALISPGEAARKLHVSTKTLQRMAERGEVASVRLPSGHRRYRLADVDELSTPVAGATS